MINQIFTGHASGSIHLQSGNVVKQADEYYPAIEHAIFFNDKQITVLLV